MDRDRRVIAALCRSSPRRANRSAIAGAATPRRPHDRRCALLGAARPARSVRAGQPVRRARDTGGCYGFAPSAGRARSRPCGQDMGALGRRHTARYRREAGTRLDRARPHHGKRRLVEPRPLGTVRRDAAAHCGHEPRGGGGERGGAAAARDPRRLWAVAARPADRPPDLGQGGGLGDRLAEAPARLLRHGGHQACAQSLDRDRGIETDREPAARRHARELPERP